MNKLFCPRTVTIECIAVKNQNQEKPNSRILLYFVVPMYFLILITCIRSVSLNPFIFYNILASTDSDTVFYTGFLCPAYLHMRNPKTTCMIILGIQPQGFTEFNSV